VNNEITRRQALTAAAACLGLTRCSLFAERQPLPRVSIVHAGYVPVFVDVSEATFN